MKRWQFLFSCLIFVFYSYAQAAAPAPLRVAASFSLLADMVRQIGGNAVVVDSLIPSGADPHLFEPQPDSAARLARAELLVVNGLGFEEWQKRLVSAAQYRGPVVVASLRVPVRRIGALPDPHAWQNPSYGLIYVDNILAALQSARPQEAANFATRAMAYRREIAALSEQLQTHCKRIPPERKRAVTTHDAFGYLGDACGVKILALQSLSSGAEPRLGDMAQLIRSIRSHRATALFAEAGAGQRYLERVAAEAKATLGGELLSDTLQAPGGAVDSYVKLLQNNINVFINGLR